MAESVVPSTAGAAAGLASELCRLRIAGGLSQRALAQALGYSAHSVVSDFEAGRRLPTNDVLVAYERLLGLPDDTLQSRRRLVLAERADELVSTEPSGLDGTCGVSSDAAGLGADPDGTDACGASLAETGAGTPGDGGGDGDGDGGGGRSVLAVRWLRFPHWPRRSRTWRIAVLAGVLTVSAVAWSVGHVSGVLPVDPTWDALTQHVSDTAERTATPEDMDGDDPRARDCVFDAVVRQVVPLYLPGRKRFGEFRLRHSAHCGASWGSALYRDPELYNVQITAYRPADGAEARSQWANNTPPGSYGDLLSTAKGCVLVEAVVITPTGKGPVARTRCMK